MYARFYLSLALNISHLFYQYLHMVYVKAYQRSYHPITQIAEKNYVYRNSMPL